MPREPLEQKGEPPTRLGSNDGDRRLTMGFTLAAWRTGFAVGTEIDVAAAVGEMNNATRMNEPRIGSILSLDLLRYTNFQRRKLCLL